MEDGAAVVGETQAVEECELECWDEHWGADYDCLPVVSVDAEKRAREPSS